MSFNNVPKRLARLARRALGRAGRAQPELGVNGQIDGVDMTHLQQLLGSAASVILEIGANDGQDSLRLAEAFPLATIHCFEPDPRALALLQQNAAGRRLQIHPFAIAADDGVVEFFQSSGAPIGREEEFPEGWHLSGSIRQPLAHLEAHPWCRFDTTIEVECRMLDSWRLEQGIQSIDLIWADVQGAEVDLIRGGPQTLSSTRYLYTEFDDRELYQGQLTLAELLELLPGWKIDDVYQFDVLLRNTALS